MTPWTHTAARQLLENWQRCGITQLPMPTNSGFERAGKWLDELYLATGLEKPRFSDSSDAPSSDLPIKAVTTAEGRVATNPIAARPAEATNTTSAPSHLAFSTPSLSFMPNDSGASVWQSASLDVSSRLRHFQVLKNDVSACRKCADIVCRRQQAVFGVGPVDAKLVMFGEAPGADEDRVGEPFVGAAGQLMNKILVASGLKREDVYIMNALKCRPPNNRTPTDGEIENCRPFFESQLETIQPEYIVCWGSVAVRAVLKTTESVGRLRGRFHSYRGAKVLVTYHPAYLLRNPDAKRLTWEDMKMLMRELGIPIPTTKRE